MSNYKLIETLAGHSNMVTALAISPNGEWLASGGVTELLVWDMATFHSRKVKRLLDRKHPGVVSCLTWLLWRGVREVFCYGTDSGYLTLCSPNTRNLEFEEPWRNRIGNGAEITCICAHHATSRIAVATRDSILQLWRVEGNDTLTSIWSITIGTTIPHALYFRPDGGAELDVLGSFDGQWMSIKTERGTVYQKTDLRKAMGSSAICYRNGLLVVDNVTNGFDLHDLDTAKYVRTFVTPPPLRKVPKQIGIGQDGRVIVVGSDHGYLYVFDKDTGKQTSALRHSKKGLVQIVTMHESPDRSLIVAASSEDVKPTITIWCHPQSSKKKSKLTITMFVEIMMKIFVTLAAVSVLIHYIQINGASLPRQRPNFVIEEGKRTILAFETAAPKIPKQRILFL